MNLVKKVLIVTASTGQGHNSVADSLKKELEKQNYEVKCIEPIKETGEVLDKLVSGGYEILATKVPSLFGMLYKASNHRLTSNSIGGILGKSIKDSTYEIIKEYKPNIIISTHPLLVKVIANLKKENKINIPFISIVTDYKAHSTYVDKSVDAYIVGSKYTKESLIEKGIDKVRIYNYGIPVKRDFMNFTNSMSREEQFTILLMGGSMGLKSMKKALFELMNLDIPLKIITVCGNNEILKRELEEDYKAVPISKELIILGFTTNISQLMDRASLIITKPGGLTVTEALVKRLPIIIPYYIPGQEEENVRFLVNEKAAIYAEGDNLNTIIKRLFNDPKELKNMVNNIDKIVKEISLDNTLNLVTSIIAS
ncbi:MGDG synthase family glycosyltransferase [Clostridium intestinale]|uniref:Monogalactosyldiacylglycerol synthase n=1 Tax=Clostridium intestinale URNW TaxID=1294142 RepID=U2N0I4_9CLOT|nr:glycosyltransferase [Clostridium intestinale]ERK29007.1 Monogalactosyldiacylglycerol synthase precursor [Clostridium intestinale URNW]